MLRQLHTAAAVIRCGGIHTRAFCRASLSGRAHAPRRYAGKPVVTGPFKDISVNWIVCWRRSSTIVESWNPRRRPPVDSPPRTTNDGGTTTTGRTAVKSGPRAKRGKPQFATGFLFPPSYHRRSRPRHPPIERDGIALISLTR